MIREWEHPGPDETDDTFRGAWRDLISFLVYSRERAAIDALAARLQSHRADDRVEVVRYVRNLAAEDGAGSLAADVDEAMQRLLVASLGDSETREGRSIGLDEVYVTDPRVGDAAAHALSRLWGNPQLFDWQASPEVRDCQRLSLLNIWRSQKGLAPLKTHKSATTP